MMSVSLFCVLVLLAVSGDALKWKQCGNTDHVLIHDLDISPSPIEIPGKNWLNLDFTILQTIHNSDVKLTMYKELMLGSIYVPCVFHMGSCTYRDTCSIGDQMEKHNWGGMSSRLATQLKKAFDDNNIDMSCPPSPQKVTLTNISLTIPPNRYGPLWDGSYKVRIQTTDIHFKREVICLDVEFSINRESA